MKRTLASFFLLTLSSYGMENRHHEDPLMKGLKEHLNTTIHPNLKKIMLDGQDYTLVDSMTKEGTITIDCPETNLYIKGHLSSTRGDIKINAKNIIHQGSLKGENINIGCNIFYANNTALERFFQISAGSEVFLVNEKKISYNQNNEDEKEYGFLENNCLKEGGAIFGDKISFNIKDSGYFLSSLLISKGDINIDYETLLHFETKIIIEAHAYPTTLGKNTFSFEEKLGPTQYIFSKEGCVQLKGFGDYLMKLNTLKAKKLRVLNKPEE